MPGNHKPGRKKTEWAIRRNRMFREHSVNSFIGIMLQTMARGENDGAILQLKLGGQVSVDFFKVYAEDKYAVVSNYNGDQFTMIVTVPDTLPKFYATAMDIIGSIQSFITI